MIQLKIKAYAELQGYNPEKGEEFSFEVKEGSSVKNLMDSLRIPNHRVMLILRNGQKANEEYLLAEGDSVFFYPVIGGG